MAEEKTTAGGQTMSDYWKDAWQKASNRELAAKELANKHARRVDLTLTELHAMKAERDRQRREKRNLAKRLTSSEMSGQENYRLAELWRAHLDDGDPDDDNEWETAARDILWNGEDTRKARERTCV